MTDTEREIRLRAKHPNPFAQAGQKVLAQDVDDLLRILDEDRAAAFEARQAAIREGLAGDEARAEIARLRERSSHANSVGTPPEADVMERAFKIVGDYVNRVGAYDLAETEFQQYENDLGNDIARALTEYAELRSHAGSARDQRAREAPR